MTCLCAHYAGSLDDYCSCCGADVTVPCHYAGRHRPARSFEEWGRRLAGEQALLRRARVPAQVGARRE